MKEGGNQRGKDNRRVGKPQELDQEEGGGAEDRRRDLPAGGGGRFDRSRKVALVAEADHGRDGERPDRDGIGDRRPGDHAEEGGAEDRDFGRRSEEHTSELQSLMRISYAVFCLKQKKYTNNATITVH